MRNLQMSICWLGKLVDTMLNINAGNLCAPLSFSFLLLVFGCVYLIVNSLQKANTKDAASLYNQGALARKKLQENI